MSWTVDATDQARQLSSPFYRGTNTFYAVRTYSIMKRGL